MAGKHSSLWDHLAWLYLRAPEQMEIAQRTDRIVRAGRMRLIRRIALSPLLGFAPAKWRVRIGVAVFAAAMVVSLVCLFIVILAAFGAGIPHGLTSAAVSVWMVTVVLGVGGGMSERAYREQECRAILLRQRRTRVLRRCDDAERRSEIALRRSWWAQRLNTKTTVREGLRYPNADRVALVCSQIPCTLYFTVSVVPKVVLRAPGGGPWTPWAIWIVPLSMFGGYLWIASRFRRARVRLTKAIENQSCPDCGYDLASTVAAGSAKDSDWIGPDRCPECGSPWPLVPPPVAVSLATSDASELDKPLAQRDVVGIWRRWRAARRSARVR